MKLIPLLLAVAISGIAAPSDAETRIGIISTATEPFTGHLQAVAGASRGGGRGCAEGGLC